MKDSMQIGDVAEQIGLSIRTIRHYDDVGLISPSARSAGGFRLYTEDDVHRLQVVKDMKPLGFTLEEMRDLLGILDHLDDPRPDGLDKETDPGRGTALQRLQAYHEAAETRINTLRKQLRIAESFAGQLSQKLTAHQPEQS